MKTNTVLFREALSIVKHAVGTKDARPVLQNVFVECDGSKAQAVAADNYRITVAPFDATADAAEKFLLPREHLSLLSAFLKQAGDTDLEITVGDKLLTFDAVGQTISLIPGNGDYPDVHSVIPISEPGVVIGVAPRFVKDIAAIAAGSGLPLKLMLYGPLSPIRIEVAGGDGYEILMPVRLADGGAWPVAEKTARRKKAA